MNVKNRKSGQALIMVTLVLIPMFGLMGLAMDLGWAYYQQKTAQAAADAAALAAVRYAFARVGKGTYACGSNGVECAAPPTPANCPGTFAGSLGEACTSATNNGFTQGGAQVVNVLACAPTDAITCPTQAGCLTAVPASCIPTAPGVVPFYWVTVRVSQQRNQLFSAVLGNTVGVSAARASAAVVGQALDASIVLLNKAGDTLSGNGPGFPGTGTNLNIGGSSSIDVPGGILMASSASGNPGNYAGTVGSSGQGFAVNSSYTHIYNTGKVDPSTLNRWNPAPQNRAKQSLFEDPYAGLGQPPPTNQVLPNCPVLATQPGKGTLPSGAVLAPGNYYEVVGTKISGSTVYIPTGMPLSVNGPVTFSATSSGTTVDYSGGTVPNNCQGGGTPVGPTGSAFGNYVFWGGLDGGSGQSTVVTIDPGRYIMAGTSGNSLLNFQSNASITDTSTSTGTSGGPGEVFILANYNYPGLSTQANSLMVGVTPFSTFNNLFMGYGSSGSELQAGSGSQSINLHAIDPTNPTIQALTDTNPFTQTKLTDYGSLAIWQDQGDSYIQYDNQGNPLGSTNSSISGNTPQFHYQGSATSTLYGIFYQPRGAWMWLQGGNLSAGQNKTQIITGALTLNGSSAVNFGNVAIPPTVRLAALVE